MKAYMIEFTYFDGVSWKNLTKKIIAKSEDQLHETFLDETKYIYESFNMGDEPRTKRELQDELWEEIHEDENDLEFPIVEEIEDNYSL